VTSKNEADKKEEKMYKGAPDSHTHTHTHTHTQFNPRGNHLRRSNQD